MIDESAFNDPDYTQDATFNNGVASLFSNFGGVSGTVTNITIGNGLTSSPNPIITTGTISLDAQLSDLTDIDFSIAPSTNQVLAYDGAKWISQTISGGSSVAFTSLTDTPNTLSGQVNNLLAVNNTGTSLTTITNNYKNSIVSGSGINVIDSTNSARILFDSSSLLENSTNSNNDSFIIQDNNDNNRRILQNNINLSNFSNDSNFITLSNLTSNSPITFSTLGSIGTIGLCTSQFDAVNFNNGVSGILSLENGGTSGSTSASARENLGLIYNVDILRQSGPSFDNNLFGDNILLQPSYFNITLGASGSSYSPGAANLVLPGYSDIGISILSVGTGGGISTFQSTQGTSFIARGNYPDFISTWSVTGVSGTGASFSVVPEINYVNFGTSYIGENSIGWRNNNGNLQIKETSGASWQSVFPITTDKISDFITTGVSISDVLIYNGNSWQSNSISGFISINSTGATSYSAGDGGINPSAILTTGSNITPSEFGTLEGMSSSRGTIQNQLDDKVGTSTVNPVSGDLIYYDGSWLPLSIGASRQILNSNTGTSIPNYDYLRNILNPSTVPGAANTITTYVSGVSGPDLAVPMYTILNEFTSGSSNGIDVSSSNNTLQINANNLETGNSLANNDELIYFEVTPDNTTKNITVENFCDEISGTGLCANGKTINIDNNNGINLGVFTVGSSPTSANQGNLAFFSDGDSGNPCLGVYVGTCWLRISLGASISST